MRHLFASELGEQNRVGTVFIASAEPHPQRELSWVRGHGGRDEYGPYGMVLLAAKTERPPEAQHPILWKLASHALTVLTLYDGEWVCFLAQHGQDRSW